MPKPLTTQKIADALQGKLIGDGSIEIDRAVHPANLQSERDLAVAMDPKLLPLLAGSKAKAAVISAKADLEPGSLDACIIVERPRVALSKLTNLFEVKVPLAPGVHPTAIVEEGVRLGKNVAIGAYTYVCAQAEIGDDSVIHPHCYIGPGAKLGAGALLHAGVKIGAQVEIGTRCIIHFNAAIGADGFSFVTPQLGSVEAAKAGGDAKTTAQNLQLLRIASLASVIIGDDVEIGASTTIDRGTLAPTRIGNGTKIDNQVQIGHNVTIGDNCMLCGRVGIAGSVKIGNRVVMGGASGAADHVIISDDAIVMAMSGVAGNVEPKGIVGGVPAVPRQRITENIYNIGRLRHFYRKFEDLIARFDKLEQNGKSG